MDMVFRVFKEQFDGKLPPPAVLKPKELWTGKQMLSMVLPDINMNSNGCTDLSNKTVCVRHGEIMTGYFDKSVLGKKEKGMIHRICLQEGDARAAQFVTEIQFMVTDYMTQHSFSTGIGDCMFDDDTMSTIDSDLIDVVEEASSMYGNEARTNQKLNMARDTIARHILDKIGPMHGMGLMIESGSKGSMVNLAQIAVAVGQQNRDGKRIGFTSKGRTLSHYERHTNNPIGRGFVKSNYVKGLSPQEFFFHMAGGREGLIDTAVKTSDTGYLERKIVKRLENVKVRYDGTVRDANDFIVQFTYGDDGYDATRLTRQRIPKRVEDLNVFDYQWQLEELVRTFQNRTRFAFEYMDAFKARHDTKVVSCPLDLGGILERCITNSKRLDIKRFKVERDITYVASRLQACVGLFNNELLVHTIICFVQLRVFLTLERFWMQFFFDQVDFGMKQIKISPGEAVGVLAGQSVAEPATQMTQVHKSPNIISSFLF